MLALLLATTLLALVSCGTQPEPEPENPGVQISETPSSWYLSTRLAQTVEMSAAVPTVPLTNAPQFPHALPEEYPMAMHVQLQEAGKVDGYDIRCEFFRTCYLPGELLQLRLTMTAEEGQRTLVYTDAAVITLLAVGEDGTTTPLTRVALRGDEYVAEDGALRAGESVTWERCYALEPTALANSTAIRLAVELTQNSSNTYGETGIGWYRDFLMKRMSLYAATVERWESLLYREAALSGVTVAVEGGAARTLSAEEQAALLTALRATSGVSYRTGEDSISQYDSVFRDFTDETFGTVTHVLTFTFADGVVIPVEVDATGRIALCCDGDGQPIQRHMAYSVTPAIDVAVLPS